MKRPLRCSPWFIGLLVAAVALCGTWESSAQTTKPPGGVGKKKPSGTSGAVPKTTPPSKKVPGPRAPGPRVPGPKLPGVKPSPETPKAPTGPDPATEILDKLPADVQDPLVGPASAKPEAAGPLGPYRPTAAGVMRVITPDRLPEESVSTHKVPEFEKLGLGNGSPHYRDVWALEFRFKPMRIIEVDVPQPSGKLQRKPIWYLLYSVTNRGSVKRLVELPDRTYKHFFSSIENNWLYEVMPLTVALSVAMPTMRGPRDDLSWTLLISLAMTRVLDPPVPFMPEFLLESVNTGKRYPDRVIPVAVAAISLREDPNRQLFNSVEIVRELNCGDTVWGVATWEDVDPKTNRFSVYIAGLTNGYTWDDPEKPYKKGDPVGEGRRLWRTTLKLNFWRPGNEKDLDESQIRLGVPGIQGAPGEPEYVWTYCDARFNERPRGSSELPERPDGGGPVANPAQGSAPSSANGDPGGAKEGG